MATVLEKFLKDSVDIRQRTLSDPRFIDSYIRAVVQLRKARDEGGTIYTCGNGGSACDAMHFSQELVGFYNKQRRPLRAQHFMDASTITCVVNDLDYTKLFSRQVEAYCTPQDVLLAISTSGNSENILEALLTAKKQSVPTILLTGRDGGKGKELADTSIIVPAEPTDRIQEMHITIIHAFCEELEIDL